MKMIMNDYDGPSVPMNIMPWMLSALWCVGAWAFSLVWAKCSHYIWMQYFWIFHCTTKYIHSTKFTQIGKFSSSGILNHALGWPKPTQMLPNVCQIPILLPVNLVFPFSSFLINSNLCMIISTSSNDHIVWSNEGSMIYHIYHICYNLLHRPWIATLINLNLS